MKLNKETIKLCKILLSAGAIFLSSAFLLTAIRLLMYVVAIPQGVLGY